MVAHFCPLDFAFRIDFSSELEWSLLSAKVAAQGWARPLRRGLILLVPLEATSPQDWSEDAWILADRLFDPGYIAGWSACGHWRFAGQIFRDMAVFTTSPICERKVTIDQTVFALRKIPPGLLFATRTVWRKDTRVKVSDPTHTAVDILGAPKWGGGIRHVDQVLIAYLNSEHHDETLLFDYLKRVEKYTAAKRLGYLLEARNSGSPALIDELQSLISEGYARLDPSAPAKGAFVARWNIGANVGISFHPADRNQ